MVGAKGFEPSTLWSQILLTYYKKQQLILNLSNYIFYIDSSISSETKTNLRQFLGWK